MISPARRRRWASALFLLALVAAACSGSTDDSTNETTTTALAAATTQPATTEEPTAPTSTTRARQRTTTSEDVTPSSRVRRPTTTAGEPLPIPEPVPPTLGTATRYGVIGCSNTDQAVRGYTEQSSKDLILGGDLGGGSAPRWGDPGNRRYSQYWALFDERRPSDGYDGVWVQLCLRNGEHGGVFDANEAAWVTHIVEQVRQRDEGIPIWVSPINSYIEGYVCTALGVDGAEIASITADWAATNLENVLRGPDFGPLAPEQIGQRDDCHPNGAGEALLGQQLIEFIDQS